jgi:hypothetical protein
MQGLSAPNLINNVTSSISPSAPNITTNSAKEPSLDKKFDIHHMSLDELKEMIQHYHEQGALSNEEAMNLYEEQFDLVHLGGGIPSDKKMDMAALFQKDIDNMKAQPGSKGVEYIENALEALQRLDMLSKAQIPRYV